jgi:hypothetical protein
LFVPLWTIFQVIFLFILPDDVASQALIQAPGTGVVFLNGDQEGHLLQIRLTLQLLD